MNWFKDTHERRIRLTSERQEHIETDHPEMSGQISKVQDTLKNPDVIVKSRTDEEVELFYRHYDTTPVTEKYLCVVVKVLSSDLFVITAYYRHDKKRYNLMAKEIKIWYDKEGDYLEVIFERMAGYFRETENDAVMKKSMRKVTL